MMTRFIRNQSIRLKLENNHDKLATCAQYVHETILMTMRSIRNQSVRLMLENTHDKLAACAQSVREVITGTQLKRNHDDSIYSQSVRAAKAETSS